MALKVKHKHKQKLFFTSKMKKKSTKFNTFIYSKYSLANRRIITLKI